MADQAKFLSFLDMIDGGGAGKMGDKFEGGGIFSAIANMIAKPYGSEDEGRKRARMRALGLLDTQPAAAPAPVTSIGRIGDNAPKPMLRPKMRPSAEDRLMQQPVKPMSAEDRLMGMPVQPNQMYAQAAAERGMGLTPFGGAGPVVSDSRGSAPAPMSDPYAYLFQGQGRPAPVEKYIPTGGTTAATGMTYGQSNLPTFQQFLAMQKQMEAQMGLQPMNEQEYLNMYQTQIQRMGM